jgi:hypothetical protein
LAVVGFYVENYTTFHQTNAITANCWYASSSIIIITYYLLKGTIRYQPQSKTAYPKSSRACAPGAAGSRRILLSLARKTCSSPGLSGNGRSTMSSLTSWKMYYNINTHNGGESGIYITNRRVCPGFQVASNR